MRNSNCAICGCNVNEIGKGKGYALMFTFVGKAFTTMSNITYCKDCYENIVENRLKECNAAMNLGIFDEDWDETD